MDFSDAGVPYQRVATFKSTQFRSNQSSLPSWINRVVGQAYSSTIIRKGWRNSEHFFYIHDSFRIRDSSGIDGGMEVRQLTVHGAFYFHTALSILITIISVSGITWNPSRFLLCSWWQPVTLEIVSGRRSPRSFVFFLEERSWEVVGPFIWSHRQTRCMIARRFSFRLFSQRQ